MNEGPDGDNLGGTAIERLRQQVAALLPDLAGVIALRRTAAGTAPHLFVDGDDLSELALAPRYEIAALVAMLQKHAPGARFGVVARGCEMRALVEMAKRNQVDPERLYLFGIACTADEAAECRCANPSPATKPWPAAEVLGQPVPGVAEDETSARFRAMPLAVRRRFWQEQFAKCIKCYGCRNICPECFCASCALEDPLWVEHGVLAPSFPTFHLIRAMHMSSRCVACRQCELACPMGIPLTTLYDLMRQDMATLFGYDPGLDIEQAPPVSLSLSDAPIHIEE